MDTKFDFIAPLFVPGHKKDRFAKAAASETDAVLIDLEDAVPAALKDEARAALTTAFTDKPVLVRINGIGTPWHEQDVRAVAAIGVTAIMVPKVERPADLAELARQHPLMALVETVKGLAAARELASSGNVVRLAFGSVDFAADLGCDHTRESLAAARAELLLASRLFDLPPPLDGVTPNFANRALTLADARHARALGFGGKLCVHPTQVSAVLEGFRPTDEELEWAQKVLSSGEGAVNVEGAMVDAPVRARAHDILSRLEAVSMRSLG